MSETQWTLKVHIDKLDAAAIRGKSKWEAGDNLSVQIEPHATVDMLKQRIALIISAHPKWQEIRFDGGSDLADILKLQDIDGLGNGSVMNVSCTTPPVVEAPPVILEDDEDLFTGEEEDLPDIPAADVISKELSDEEMDKQGELKQAAQEAIEDGDMKVGLAKFTEAMMIGGVSAMMFGKRAEMLLKQKRYKAAIADATQALTLNPDSAKAYRARGKARRFIGEYEGSAADLSQAQSIDYNDGDILDIHKYVQTRWEKIQLKTKQDAKKAADEAAMAD